LVQCYIIILFILNAAPVCADVWLGNGGSFVTRLSRTICEGLVNANDPECLSYVYIVFMYFLIESAL
jgi:hypothetical protein